MLYVIKESQHKGDVLAFLLRKETTMADLINRDKAIQILQRIQEQHAKRTCQRSALLQATAIGYAIEVIRKLPSEQSS